MRKVILSNLVSLDGFMAGPNGEIDWFTGVADKEFESYAVDLIDSIDTMLFGRVTYELMAGYWPAATPETDDPRIIEAMNNTRKVVFSNTLGKVDWKNSRLVKGDAAEETAKLKEQSGRDMVIYGSGGIVSALAPKGLIDDYRIFVAPIVLGKGKPLFDCVDTRIRLELLETKSFRSGMVVLRYGPDGIRG
jgi:dihydrofolate reductase